MERAVDQQLLRQKLSETESICREGFDNSSILQSMETKVNEVMELQEINYDLQAQLQHSQDQIKLMEAEFAFQRNQLEDELEKSKNRATQLEAALENQKSEASSETTDIEKLKSLVIHLQNRINRRDAKIAALEEQLRMASNQENVPNLETEKLRNRLFRAKAQIERAKEIELVNKTLEEKLRHCESEYDILNDILCVQSRMPVTEDWIPVRKELQNLIRNSEKLRATEELLSATNAKFEDFQKRLKEEHSRHMESVTADTTARERKIEELERTNLRIGKFVEQQQIRVNFTRAIAQSYNDVMSKVDKLHSAIVPGGEHRLFRPFVMATVFLVRWRKMHHRAVPTPYDASSLMSFATVPPVTFGHQIDQITSQFATLTRTVVHLKEKLAVAEEEAVKMKNEIRQLSCKTGEGLTEAGILRNTIECQKKRMSKLQEEAAMAVPPEKFQEVLSNLTNLEIEVDQKNEEIVTLNDVIEEKTQLLNEQNTKIRELTAEREARKDEVEDIRAICENRCHEIELLKMKLKDKTKEMLALERIIDQVKPLLPSIIAIELPNESEDSSSAPVNMDCVEATEVINPSFLGKI